VSLRKRLAIDILFLTALVLAYEPSATGLSLHEWLCVAVALPALVHLVVNWDWVVRVSRTFSRRLRRASGLNLVVDTALFVTTVTVMLSGILISRVVSSVVGFVPTTDPAWYRVHSFSADAVMVIVALHLALHWRWFARALRGRGAGSARRRPVVATGGGR